MDLTPLSRTTTTAVSNAVQPGWRNQAIALKTPAKGLSDGSGPIRQHARVSPLPPAPGGHPPQLKSQPKKFLRRPLFKMSGPFFKLHSWEMLAFSSGRRHHGSCPHPSWWGRDVRTGNISRRRAPATATLAFATHVKSSMFMRLL